jgi:hypothetical protein
MFSRQAYARKRLHSRTEANYEEIYRQQGQRNKMLQGAERRAEIAPRVCMAASDFLGAGRRLVKTASVRYVDLNTR